MSQFSKVDIQDGVRGAILRFFLMATVNNVLIFFGRMCQAKMNTDIFMAQNFRADLCLIGVNPGLFSH